MAAIPGKHVLYLAIQPTPEAAAQAHDLVAAARGPHRLTAKPVAADRLHVSLYKLGDFKRPPGVVTEKAVDVIREVGGRPFTVAFNRMGTWNRGDPTRPIVLWGDEGVIGVHGLFADLHKQLVRKSMASRRDPPFEPHMTLVYDRAEMPETIVQPVRWKVEEFVLIHAVHGEGRYEVVERFPLEG